MGNSAYAIMGFKKLENQGPEKRFESPFDHTEWFVENFKSESDLVFHS